MRLRLAALIFADAILAAQVPQIPGCGVNFYSREKEAVLGAGLAKEMRRGTTPIDNPRVQAYVEQLGAKLAAQLPEAGCSYTLAVIADHGRRTHEPISLPGGYIFVRSDLFLAAQDEAEFTGMLAHAMAHTADRHSTRMATRGQIVNLASIPLIFMGGWAGAGDHAAVAIPIGFLSFHRKNELDADLLAVGMMDGAGYDPWALSRYIGRTQPPDSDPPKPTSVLPPLSMRLERITLGIQELPRRTYSARDDEFKAIQEEIRALPADQPRRAPSLRKNSAE
jgi:predicted Zn-dependent protease